MIIQKRLAQKFQLPFLIPVQVNSQWHNQRYESYVTNDRYGKLNHWILVENEEQVYVGVVDWYIAQHGA